MKRVIMFNDPGGLAVGWDPNGTTTTFTISEPEFNDIDGSFVSIALSNAGNVVCIISQFITTGGFSLACITAPPNDAELHYVVENLPPHGI